MSYSRGRFYIEEKCVNWYNHRLILLFPILRNAFNEIIAPEKVLIVYKQVDEHTFELTREIKDKKRLLILRIILMKSPLS